MSFMDYIAQEPVWLQIWIFWTMFINLAGFAFVWRRVEPRWVVAAFIASALMMNGLFAIYGYEKILGLAHIVFWVPLLIYLFLRRHIIGQYRTTAVYLALVFGTNLTSLAFDFYDVMTYFLSP